MINQCRRLKKRASRYRVKMSNEFLIAVFNNLLIAGRLATKGCQIIYLCSNESFDSNCRASTMLKRMLLDILYLIYFWRGSVT